MAALVRIFSVNAEQVGNQPPSRVVVSGVVDVSCSVLRIRLLTSGTGSPQVVTIGTVSTTANVPWELTFTSPADFTSGTIACGDDFKVEATCDGQNCGVYYLVSPSIVSCNPLPPAGTKCPDVALAVTFNNPPCSGTDVPAVIKVTLSGDVPRNFFWELEYGDGVDDAANSAFVQNNTQNPLEITISHTYQSVPGLVTPRTVVFRLPVNNQLCETRASITIPDCPVIAPTCPDPDDFDLEIYPDGSAQPIARAEAHCLPPGIYQVKVSAPTSVQVDSVTWVVNDVRSVGDEVDVTISAGEDTEVNASIAVAGCGAYVESLDLFGCRDCTEIAIGIEVIPDRPADPAENPESDCFLPGGYTLRAVGLPSDYETIAWSEDGVFVDGETGEEYHIELAEGEERRISVAVVAANCLPSRSVFLRACECPDEISIEILDAQGESVGTRCVRDGEALSLRAVGDGLEDVEIEWEVGGVDLGNGTEVGLVFQRPGDDTCPWETLPTVPVRLTASGPGCELEENTSISACRQDRPCFTCWLIEFFLLISLGIIAIALAVMLCQDFLKITAPPSPDPATLVLVAINTAISAAAIAAAPAVFVTFLLIFVALLIFWILRCEPDWCRNWVPLIWKAAALIGIMFIYFGLCPACAVIFLPIGIIALLVAVGFFIYWLTQCSPSTCTIYRNLGDLVWAQSLIGVLEILLAGCVVGWSWIIMLIIGVLHTVYWIGLNANGCISE
jgi:hypothetical protein